MKREGVEFTCDRCGMKAFVEYSNGNIGLYEEPKGWSTAAKDPTNLKQLGKNISNLCPQCTEEYKKLAESFQLMFRQYTCNNSLVTRCVLDMGENI